MSEDLLTWAEVAVALGCSVRTVQRLKANGQIGYTTRGVGSQPRVYFRQSDVDKYLQTATVKPATTRRTA